MINELVRRYVMMNLRRDNDEGVTRMTSWWRHDDDNDVTVNHDEGVTEDDVIEIKHDISALRYELLDVFRTNGMKLPSIHPTRQTSKRRATTYFL